MAQSAGELAWSRIAAPIKQVGTEAVWIALGQGIGALALLVSGRIMTTVLTPSAYGELALAVALATLLTQTIQGPVVHAGERFFAAARQTQSLGQYFSALSRLSLGAAALIGGLAVLGGVVCVVLGRLDLALVIAAAAAFALLSGLESTVDAVENAARRRRIVGFHQAFRQVVRPLCAAPVLLITGPNSLVALLMYAVAAGATLASQLVFLRPIAAEARTSHAAPAGSAELGRSMLNYGLPLATWGLCSAAQVTSDRWALQAFSNTETVGLYAIVAQIGMFPLSMLGAAVSQLLGPVLFAVAADGSDSQRVARALRLNGIGAALLLVLTGLGFGIALAAHQLLFRLLVAPEYAPAAPLLPLAVVVGGLLGVGNVLALAPLVARAPRRILAPRLGSALVFVALNCAGAWLGGAEGVLWAGIAGSLVYVVWMALIAFAPAPSQIRTPVQVDSGHG